MPIRVFTIQWSDHLGPLWMNKDNLRLCLESKEHVGPRVKLEISDITDHVHTCKPVQAYLKKNNQTIPHPEHTETPLNP